MNMNRLQQLLQPPRHFAMLRDLGFHFEPDLHFVNTPLHAGTASVDHCQITIRVSLCTKWLVDDETRVQSCIAAHYTGLGLHSDKCLKSIALLLLQLGSLLCSGCSVPLAETNPLRESYPNCRAYQRQHLASQNENSRQHRERMHPSKGCWQQLHLPKGICPLGKLHSQLAGGSVVLSTALPSSPCRTPHNQEPGAVMESPVQCSCCARSPPGVLFVRVRQLCRFTFILTRLHDSSANIKPLWQVRAQADRSHNIGAQAAPIHNLHHCRTAAAPLVYCSCTTSCAASTERHAEVATAHHSHLHILFPFFSKAVWRRLLQLSTSAAQHKHQGQPPNIPANTTSHDISTISDNVAGGAHTTASHSIPNAPVPHSQLLALLQSQASAGDVLYLLRALAAWQDNEVSGSADPLHDRTPDSTCAQVTLARAALTLWAALLIPAFSAACEERLWLAQLSARVFAGSKHTSGSDNYVVVVAGSCLC